MTKKKYKFKSIYRVTSIETSLRYNTDSGKDLPGYLTNGEKQPATQPYMQGL